MSHKILVAVVVAVSTCTASGARMLNFDVLIRLENNLHQMEVLKGRIVQSSHQSHLTLYWHEPMSRHSWENGPLGCSEWLLTNDALHYWFRDEKLSGSRRGVLKFSEAPERPFKPPLEFGVLKGVDIESITYLLSQTRTDSEVPDGSLMPPLLWSRDALRAFWSGETYEVKIEPETIPVFVTPTGGFLPEQMTIEQFPPFGRVIRVTHDAEVSRLEVRRLLDDAPILELSKTIVREGNSEVGAAIEPEDLGSLSAAPAPFRAYWQLQGELETLDRSQAQPESFVSLWVKARDVLTEELPQPLDVAIAQIYVRAAASAVNLEATTNAVESFLAVAKGTDYERWSVYEAGQAIDLLLDAGIPKEQLETLASTTAKTIVVNGYMGDDQNLTMLVDDLIASGWPFYAEKLIGALEDQGEDAQLLKALQSRLDKSVERANYVIRAPEATPITGVDTIVKK